MEQFQNTIFRFCNALALSCNWLALVTPYLLDTSPPPNSPQTFNFVALWNYKNSVYTQIQPCVEL
jgi:hypothetical protein